MDRTFIMLQRLRTQNKSGPVNSLHFIYPICDDNAQDMMLQAQLSNMLSVNGSPYDPSRETLFEKILNNIAKATPTEHLSLVVDIP